MTATPGTAVNNSAISRPDRASASRCHPRSWKVAWQTPPVRQNRQSSRTSSRPPATWASPAISARPASSASGCAGVPDRVNARRIRRTELRSTSARSSSSGASTARMACTASHAFAGPPRRTPAWCTVCTPSVPG
ncbi:hypothetical protein [Phytohabitans rumicis]|uniref:hypothetical protein n=1 Tax=Phytohabitans rumicis TaxID=1076125 RepID=UPI001FEC417E|nr:hypothetical protein [Phytohabitans rumicis]